MSKKKQKIAGKDAIHGRDAINRVSTGNRIAMRNTKYLTYALLAILVLLIIFIRLKLDGIPMERDEGIYAYGGRMILDGKVPYLDFYEQKFPGLFYFILMQRLWRFSGVHWKAFIMVSPF